MRIFILTLIFFAFAPAIVMAAEDSMPSISMPMTEEGAPPTAEKNKPAEQVYICPMHPHIHGKKGDKCPICGMDLVPQTETQPMTTPPENGGEASPEDQKKSDQSGSLQITPAYRQALGVKTAPAQMQEFGKAIHAFGTIAPSTRKEYAIAVRTSGWVADLQTNAVGDTVKKGDLLFTFYSPDLLSAQADYLVGLRGGKIIGAPSQRLRLYGMDDKAIAELKAKGSFLEQTPFYAPAGGTVMTLNVRKGSYVDAEDGDNMILSLQDYSQVWVEAHVPIKDLQFLTIGTPATITVDETGKTIKAVTDYIYPMTDMESRKGMVRLVVDNPDGKLKTGSIVNAVFEAGSEKRLAVPADAVLYGKDGGHVIEALDNGYFRPVAVKAGITAHGLTEIVSGLKEGQSIVESGQFMIDAESNLRGGMANMAGMDMKDMPAPEQKGMKDMPGMDMEGDHAR